VLRRLTVREVEPGHADGNLPVASSYTGHKGRRWWRPVHQLVVKDDLKLPEVTPMVYPQAAHGCGGPTTDPRTQEAR
jgi:hypothetical protein